MYNTVKRLLDIIIIVLLITILVPSEWFKRKVETPIVASEKVQSLAAETKSNQPSITQKPSEQGQPVKVAEGPAQQGSQLLPVVSQQEKAPSATPSIARKLNTHAALSPAPTVQSVSRIVPAPAAKQKLVVVKSQKSAPAKSYSRPLIQDNQTFFKLGVFKKVTSINHLKQMMNAAKLPVRLVQKDDMTVFFVGPIDDQSLGQVRDTLKKMQLPIIMTRVKS